MITNSTGVIMEYEMILLGQRDKFSRYYFNFSKKQNESTALLVFRYAFEKLLKWRPDEIRDCISMEILKKMKLDILLDYIELPPELLPTDLYYIAHMMYPEKIKYNTEDLVLTFYHRVLSKEFDRYPKYFFSGEQGSLYARICLRDMISNSDIIKFNSIAELYEQFSDAPKIMSVLRKNFLDKACKTLFSSPLEYLHSCLPDKSKDGFLYEYYEFSDALKKEEETDVTEN